MSIKKSRIPFAFKNDFRPIFEHEAATAWAVCATATIVTSTSVYSFGIVPIALLGFSLYQMTSYGLRAHRHFVRQSNLFKNNLDFVSSDKIHEIKVKKGVEPEAYLYLGEGFEWGANEAQQAFQINSMDDEFEDLAFPSWAKKIYISEKEISMVEELGGKTWIDAIGDSKKKGPVLAGMKGLEGHTFIVGATGAGKTRMLELILTQLIQRNEPIFIIDPKGDLDLMKRAKYELKRLGRESDFKLFHPAKASNSVRIDCLINFSRNSEIASRVSSLMPSEGDAVSFKNFAWRAINIVTQGMLFVQMKPSLKRIRYYVSGNMSELLKEVLEKFYKDVYGSGWKTNVGVSNMNRDKDPLIKMIQYYKSTFIGDQSNEVVDGLIGEVEHDATHYGKMIASLLPLLDMLASGDVGDLLSPDYDDPDDHREILNLSNSIESSHVVYIALDSLSDSEVGSSIGSLILSEAAAISGTRYNYGTGSSRYVNLLTDETSEVLNVPMLQLLNKGRGSGMKIFFCSQSVSDLEDRMGGEAGMRQVLGNANNLISLRVLDKVTQEYCVESFGVAVIQSTMFSMSNNSSSSANPTEWGGGYSERLSKEEKELVAASTLGKLPNLQYFARLQDGRIIKGRVPLLDKVPDDIVI